MQKASKEPVIHVAVVEDDRKYREGLEFLLNASDGISCVSAVSTSREALVKFTTLKPQPDVVLLGLDLGPGEPDGVESLPGIRELLPESKFLMLTGIDQPDRVFETVRRGARGYLRKGASFKELPAAIREVQAGYPRLSPDVFQLIYAALQNPSPVTKEWFKLSEREREVLELQALGFEPKEITARLGFSYETLKSHCKHICNKLEVRTRNQAVRKVFPKKLLSMLPR